MNFANYVDITARNHGDALAVADPGREATYAELSRETDAVANGLAELGVDPGDRVALFLPNSVTFLTAYFGAMKRGAVPVPINLRFDPETIGFVLRRTDASVLVTSGRFEDAVTDRDVDVEHLVVADGDAGIGYDELLGSGGRVDVCERRDDELAELLFTSGTTGRPKGVKHTHGNLAANGWGYVRYFEFYSAEAVGLTVVPLFHAAGLNVTATPLTLVGAENHFLPAWDAETALETMAGRGVTTAMFVPTMVIDLLEFGTEGYDLSALSHVIVGGSPMPKERIEAAEAALGVTLLEGYGMTETTPAAAVNRPDQAVRKAGSIGPPMRDLVDVRIEDPGTGEVVGVDEKGELLWRGDTVTPGYWNDPEANAESFVEREGETWLRSGDIGRVDEDGHLFVEDRLDDMIVTGGENVYPREVEDVVYELDGVVEVSVVGTPHDRLGEQVTAVVVGDGTVTASGVEAVCRDRLADYKVPRAVEFVESIPKTSTRKVDKVALRERFGGDA
jgi:long-chain acyl-CoA synthetase